MASMIGFPGEESCSTTFNALVPGIVANHKANGMKIVYVLKCTHAGTHTHVHTRAVYPLNVPLGRMVRVRSPVPLEELGY